VTAQRKWPDLDSILAYQQCHKINKLQAFKQKIHFESWSCVKGDSAKIMSI
jgi:hypothetical protein